VSNTEEFNYIIGWDIGKHGLSNGRAIIRNEVHLAVDYGRPITFTRALDVLAKARQFSQRDLGAIDMCHSVYTATPGNEMGEGREACLHDVTYRFDGRLLTKFDRGECVMLDDGATQMRGDDARVAYTDTLDTYSCVS
jgi:hypothetical protein